MGLLSTLRDHAAVASGNFVVMFKDTEFPALPQAVSRLLSEINKTEPDINRIETIIAAEPGIATKVLRTVNSSLYGLKREVMSVRHGITMLGLIRIRSLVLSYALLEGLPKTKTRIFDHEAFWTDCLLRSLLARELSKCARMGEPEAAFTAMLIADVSLPVLLTVWQKYYEPVIADWADKPQRLSDLEEQQFGWTHAQAAAWLLLYWEFPEEMVCVAGAHHLTTEEICALGLTGSVVMPVAIAALLPSILKPQTERLEAMIQRAADDLKLSPEVWTDLVAEISGSFRVVAEQFGLYSGRANLILEALSEAAASKVS